MMTKSKGQAQDTAASIFYFLYEPLICILSILLYIFLHICNVGSSIATFRSDNPKMYETVCAFVRPF